MKKIVSSLLIITYSLFVSGQVSDLSGMYISKTGDQEYKLYLMENSSFIFYQPQNNMYGLCKTVNGTWTLSKNNLILNTNLQSYYEFQKEPAEDEDSISFEILSIYDSGIGIYPFTKVFLLNDKDEKLYEEEINDRGYIKFPSINIEGNKIVIPSFLSMNLSGEYSNYIEKGFDYKLVVSGCNFEIWRNKVSKVKKGHTIILRDGKFKYKYTKEAMYHMEQSEEQ